MTPAEPRSPSAASEPALSVTIISLASAHERRAQVARSFADCPFPWRILDASDGSTTMVPYQPQLAVARSGRELKRSEVGVFDSHLRAWRGFADSPDARALMVCEDDVVVDFSFQFDVLVEAMDRAGVDYVRLFSRRLPAARHVVFWRDRWLVRYRWEPFGTQCYVITQRGAERLLSSLSAIARPIDNELDRFWENGLPAYSIFPHPVLELASPSSIVRSVDSSWSRLRRTRHQASRAWDRVMAAAASTRGRALDRRFAAALESADQDLSTSGRPVPAEAGGPDRSS